MPFTDKETDVHETPCPRCGGEASYRPADDPPGVEVSCPDCGQFAISQSDFDQAVSDISEPVEPD